MTDQILCVDDDALVLKGYQRALRRFSLDVALGPEQALAAIVRRGPYAVVVSDMRMPHMNGLTLLAEIRKLAPDTVPMMLTGDADQQAARAAVQQGRVFRFLTKPCPPDALANALEDGLEQYRLIVAQRQWCATSPSGSAMTAVSAQCET